MIYYVIHTKMHCPWGRKAVALLKEKEIPFILIDYDNIKEADCQEGGSSYPLQEVKDKWDWQTIPIILEVDKEHCGGCGAEGETIEIIGGFDDLKCRLD
jgi:glutaredoxin